MQDLKFRVLKKDDIKAVVELINKAYRENNPNSWTSEAHLLSGIRVNEDMLNEILKNKNIVTYIALLDEKIVATIQTKLEDEDIHIGLFAVHPDFQSFGVGKNILNNFIYLKISFLKTKSFNSSSTSGNQYFDFGNSIKVFVSL